MSVEINTDGNSCTVTLTRADGTTASFTISADNEEFSFQLSDTQDLKRAEVIQALERDHEAIAKFMSPHIAQQVRNEDSWGYDPGEGDPGDLEDIRDNYAEKLDRAESDVDQKLNAIALTAVHLQSTYDALTHAKKEVLIDENFSDTELIEDESTPGMKEQEIKDFSKKYKNRDLQQAKKALGTSTTSTKPKPNQENTTATKENSTQNEELKNLKAELETAYIEGKNAFGDNKLDAAKEAMDDIKAKVAELEAAGIQEKDGLFEYDGQTVTLESLKEEIELGDEALAKPELESEDTQEISGGNLPNYDAYDEATKNMQAHFKALAATGGEFTKLDPDEVDGLRGKDTKPAMAAYIEMYDLKDLDISTSEGRQKAVVKINEDIQTRMANNDDFLQKMRDGTLALHTQGGKHETRAENIMVKALNYASVDELKKASPLNLQRHFMEVVDPRYLKAPEVIAKRNVEESIGKLDAKKNLVEYTHKELDDVVADKAWNKSVINNTDKLKEYKDAFGNSGGVAGEKRIHIDGDRLVYLEQEGQVFSARALDTGSLLERGGLSGVPLTASTVQRLGLGYDLADKLDFIKDPSTGIVKEINGPGGNDYEVLVYKGESGELAGFVVTDEFLQGPNKAFYDRAKAQTPDAIYDKSARLQDFAFNSERRNQINQAVVAEMETSGKEASAETEVVAKNETGENIDIDNVIDKQVFDAAFGSGSNFKK